MDIKLVQKSFNIARKTFDALVIRAQNSTFYSNIQRFVLIENAMLTLAEQSFHSSLQKLPTRNVAYNPVEKHHPLIAVGAILGPILGIFSLSETQRLSGLVTDIQRDQKKSGAFSTRTRTICTPLTSRLTTSTKFLRISNRTTRWSFPPFWEISIAK